MKTYRITIFDIDKLNDYIIGKISGIIWGISGMPEVEAAWMKNKKENLEHHRFCCTEEQCQAIFDAINKRYGKMVSYKIEEIVVA